MSLLTKSKYLIGKQCPKYLWVTFHEPDKIPEPDLTAQYRMDQGILVSEMAKMLFPEGIGVPTDDFIINIKKTKELLKEGKPLFEPGFKFGNCYSRGDILVPIGNEWDVIEVKSGTKVKDFDPIDVSFQRYCYEGEGLNIRRCYLLHINNEYVRKGDVDPEQLFVKEDITGVVNAVIMGVPGDIKEMLKVISAERCPETVIGKHCKDPRECPLKNDCWDFLPENNVFDLYYGGEKSYELFRRRTYAIKDIPDDFQLNPKQHIQRECERTGKEYVNKDSIKNFLRNFEYPLNYLDFETFTSAVPMFDGIKPWQQVPFQFSLHVVKEEGADPEHYSFLHSSKEDPRSEFASRLKEVLGDSGSIVVYNQRFEKKVLKELGAALPEYKGFADSLVTRFVDLLIPFSNFFYYNPSQRGSASMKGVLPALTGKDYSGLEIVGETAGIEFLNITFGDVSEEERKKVRENLEKYCRLDTEGMIWIVDRLRELAE